MEITGAAIKDKHQGKKLLNKMFVLNQDLGKEKNFKYAFGYVINFKSGIAFQKLGWKRILEKDCTNLDYKGLKPFAKLSEDNKKPALWLKEL